MIEDKDNDIKDNLLVVDKARTTIEIENEMRNYMDTEEGEKIKADIDLLFEMGYDKIMINKVYILLQPEHIDRAIEYMTEENGIYQHNFFKNDNSKKDQNICFICGKTKRYHLDYIPEEFIAEGDNNFLNNDLDIRISGDSFHFSDDDNYYLKNEKKDIISNECSVCYEEIDEEEKKFNVFLVDIYAVLNAG